ncbi:winged helix-turn-helix domain-containing protein [Thiobaca trueperi]|nr:LysR family transcriptional regulator [Thiobaca trueperi]
MSHFMEPEMAIVRPLQFGRAKPGFAGHQRVELLRRISETGSISQAAKAMGVSYRHAWKMIDAMNQSAAEPLVRCQTGGQHGGGTALTDEGRRLIAVCDAAEQEHRRFLATLGRRLKDFDRFYELLI